MNKSKFRCLIACEESGAVTKAFRELGHEAYSCDLIPTSGEYPEYHYKMDIFQLLKEQPKWDLLIGFPTCTFLTVTGNKWMKDEYKDRFPTRQQDRKDAIKFFMDLINLDIPRIAIENPIGIMSTIYRKPDQIIHPWQFGHQASKSTCLWLKNLPLLTPTNIVDKGEVITFDSGKKMQKWYADCWKLSPQERSKSRSKTFEGIAKAMANQYSEYILNYNN